MDRIHKINKNKTDSSDGILFRCFVL